MPVTSGGGTPAPKPKKRKVLKVAAKPSARSTLPVRSAVNALNKEAGRPVAKVVKKVKKADVKVRYGLGGNKYAGEYFNKKKKDVIKINRFKKNIYKKTDEGDFVVDKSEARQTVEHELGHALGLGHKGKKKNLMNASGTNTGRNLTRQQTRAIGGKVKKRRPSDAVRSHRGK